MALKPIPRCLLNLVLILLDTPGFSLQAISRYLHDLVSVVKALAITELAGLENYNVLRQGLTIVRDVVSELANQAKSQIRDKKLDALRSCPVVNDAFNILNIVNTTIDSQLNYLDTQLVILNIITGKKDDTNAGLQSVIVGLGNLADNIDLFITQYPDKILDSEWVKENLPVIVQDQLV